MAFSPWLLFLITELFPSYTLSLPRQLSLPPLCLLQQLLLWQYFQLAGVLRGPQFLYLSLPHSAYFSQGTAVSMLNQYPHVCSQRPEVDTGLSYMHLNPDQLYLEDSVPITGQKIHPSLALSAAVNSKLMPVMARAEDWH